MKTLTTEQFIERSKQLHGEVYNYSSVAYKHSHTTVQILCQKHGIFEQSPNNHLKGAGCPICGLQKKKDTLNKKKGINL